MSYAYKLVSSTAMLVFVTCMAGSCEKDKDDGPVPVYLKASNPGIDDGFGNSLVWAGTELVVGASRESSAAVGNDGDQQDDSAPGSGAVYVFRQGYDAPDLDTRQWPQVAYIKASNTGAGDRFGYSVAMARNWIAVGAFGEGSAATGVNGDQSDDSAPESGAVYVFRRIGGPDDNVWEQEAYIKASNTEAGDRFGFSVSVWGDTLVVGAPGEDGAATGINGDQSACCATDSGAVYAFQRVSGQWQQEAYIKSSVTAAGRQFGYGVAFVNYQLAATAPHVAPAAHVFERSGASWEETARLPDSADAVPEGFGYSVDMWGMDTFAVGSPFEGSGAVYVFCRNAEYNSCRHDDDRWWQEARIEPPNGDEDNQFGYSVSIIRNYLAVGAIGEARAAGAAYLFWRGVETYEEQAVLEAPNPDPGDEFGWGVALDIYASIYSSSPVRVAVGATGEAGGSAGFDGDQSDESAPGSGAVYTFESGL